MRALITGASGFVGRHLSAHLLECGDEVVGTDRASAGGARYLDVLDPASIAAVFDATRPEVVYHLVGYADIGGSWTEAALVFSVNAMGTLNVLEAARAVGVGRTLVVSSADVYGVVPEREQPITEDYPLRPVSPYAVSKAAADLVALQAHLGNGDDVVRIRAFNLIGPGQTDRFFAAAVAHRIVANERSGDDDVPVGNLASSRDFTDVRDVVGAYRRLAVDGEAGEAYNVCRGVGVPMQQVAQRLLDLAERPMRLVIDPARYRPVDVPSFVGDAGKLRRATGWEPHHDLGRTLGDLLDHVRLTLPPDC